MGLYETSFGLKLFGANKFYTRVSVTQYMPRDPSDAFQLSNDIEFCENFFKKKQSYIQNIVESFYFPLRLARLVIKTSSHQSPTASA